jgi:hypothetical protein
LGSIRLQCDRQGRWRNARTHYRPQRSGAQHRNCGARRRILVGFERAARTDVEAQAQQNGGTLPALFSRSNNSQVQHYSQVWIWDEWQSVLDPRRGGRIPNHVIVTSGPKKKPSDGHYALICHSNQKLTLGSLGYCDLAPPHCRTLKNRKSLKYITGARLLEKQLPLFSRKGSPSASVRSVEFEASLIGHCYVKLRGIPRVLTQAQLNSLRQYQPGDDWLGLVKKLRP